MASSQECGGWAAPLGVTPCSAGVTCQEVVLPTLRAQCGRESRFGQGFRGGAMRARARSTD
jgi:hypothetical protein